MPQGMPHLVCVPNTTATRTIIDIQYITQSPPLVECITSLPGSIDEGCSHTSFTLQSMIHTCESQLTMDLKAKPRSTTAVDLRSSRRSRDSIVKAPSLYLSHCQRQHALDRNPQRARGGETVRQNITTPGDRRLMRASADTQVAKARTPVRQESGLMPHPRPTRTCEEDDSDDVFGIGIKASSKLDAKASREEIGVQRVLGGKHRAHSIALKAPYRRIRTRDNLNDIFEGMRAQGRPLSTQPEPKVSSHMSMSRSRAKHYTESVFFSTRASKALASVDERVSAEPSHDDEKEAGRFKDDFFGPLVIRKSIKKLIAEAENLDRSWLLGRDVNAMERKVRSELL